MLVYYLQMIDNEEDKCKFERLYLRYRGLLFAVAMKILRNPQDAEDAVQQAFLSIIENLNKISGTDCPETRSYAVTITERKAIDILRARSKIADQEFDETAQGLEIPPPGDSGLADAMAKLPARYRTVLLLRYDNGYDTGELAEILHIKRESVNRLLWRAKEALKEAVREGGGTL